MYGGGLAKLGGVCGLLFVSLMVPAYVVGYPDAPTSTSGAREVLGYFGTSAGTFVLFNGTLALLSTFFFLWFLGVLYGVMRRPEGVDGILSTWCSSVGSCSSPSRARVTRSRSCTP